MTARTLAIAAASTLLGACETTTAQDTAPPSRFDRMGVYVTVDNVDRSEAFYTDILGTAPDMKFPGFTAYSVSGGLLAIVSRARFAPGTKPGDSVAPYIRTPDMAALVEALKASRPNAIAEGPLVEPGITILKVRDPDGNLIEFYAMP